MSGQWKLVASAGTLDGLAELWAERMHWGNTVALSTDDPNVWNVAHKGGELLTDLRVFRSRGRFRLERPI